MVHQILDLLDAGKGFSDIRQDYLPDITDNDISACIRFARQLVQNEEIHFAEEFPDHCVFEATVRLVQSGGP